MKFLVLAFFVCAASAATFPAFKPYQAKAFASVSVPQTYAPVVQVARVAPVPKVTPFVPAPAVTVTKPVVSVVKSVATDKDTEAVILRSDSEVNPDSFAYSYKSSNGIAASSSGFLKKVDNVDTLNVEGQFQFISPEGLPVVVSYVANENGFQPSSDILPKAPPVPEAILRALEYIAAHPQKEETLVKKF